MADVREEVTELLEDRPELAEDLRALTETDQNQDSWKFDEVAIDSGAFGELVSRGVVEKSGDEYWLVDRHQVQVALGDATPKRDLKSVYSNFDFGVQQIVPAISGRTVGGVMGGLLIVFVFRAFIYTRVFRGGDVVLLANDPYFYRYHVVKMLNSGAGVLDVPAGIQSGEPLLVSLLVGVTRMFGGTVDTAEIVLAWYPVFAGVCSAVLCYSLAVTLSRDRRVGLAALVVLAVLPVHAYRTALGFADHHALDFFWLTVVAVSAVRTLPSGELMDVNSSWGSKVFWASILAVGIAGQTLSWTAAPLLIAPIIIYAVVRSAALVYSGGSILAEAPLILGVAGGGLISIVGHSLLGWQPTVIVVAPWLVTLGVLFAVTTAAVVRRLSLPAWTASVIATLSTLLAVGVVLTLEPSFAADFNQEFSRLVGMSGSEIAETKSLFSTDYGLFAAPFFFYGTALVFAIPAGAWAFYYGVKRPQWLMAGSFGLLLFLLALVQVRFAGELAVFVAVFAGFSFVYLLDVLDITTAPAILTNTERQNRGHPGTRSVSIPEASTIVSIGLAFLLVGGLGAVMTPIRTSTIVPSEDTYQAASWMDDAVESPNWTRERQYVFSHWNQNRMYNSFVTGNSESYGYARSNYAEFLNSRDGDEWYSQLRGRTGFIVVDESEVDNLESETVGTSLANWGSGLGNYRAVWTRGSKTVYTLVPGAVISGMAEENATITLSYQGNVSGQPIKYERATNAASGTYRVRVPYAGKYTIQDKVITVSERAVQNGSVVNASASSSRAR